MPYSEITALLQNGIDDGIMSAAQCVIARGDTIVYSEAIGSTRFENGDPITPQSIFDLASLTKPLATATAIARLIEIENIAMDDAASLYLPGLDSRITIRQLLNHSSGLPDWKPYYELAEVELFSRDTLYDAILMEPLISEPGTQARYSDLDFILLGFLIESVSEMRLDHYCSNQVYEPLKIESLSYLPIGETSRFSGQSCVATEDCPRRGLLIGEVHDDNAHAAGGVCGHAGLFGTAEAVAGLAGEWRKALKGNGNLFSRPVAHDFAYPLTQPPRSSYVAGWDRPTWKVSQGGHYLTPHSIGHLGFTGTSVWYDIDRDTTIVVLTNRVHPSRNETRIGELRSTVHNRIFELLDDTRPGPFCDLKPKQEINTIHLTGIAGTGMGSLAGMLKEAGYSVRGSDQAVYPPMSDLLERLAIPVAQPFDPKNLTPTPDLTIIGNVCTRDHVEVTEVRRNNLPHDSFPGALSRLFLEDKTSLVVAGTHGKTTTSAMVAWLLKAAEADPSFMIGGLVQNFGNNYRLGAGSYFVIEGDEYDSAYFDKNPKFLHYMPHGAIVTSIEYDHADIYDSVEEIEERFLQFVELIPEDGVLVACADYAAVRRCAKSCKGKVLLYGSHPEAEYTPHNVENSSGATTFTIYQKQVQLCTVSIPMAGPHNIQNAMAAILLLHHYGFNPVEVADYFQSFQGVARRQQVRGEVGGIRVIDDFAHHPTAVAVTLEGLRVQYPDGKLLVAMDPRTNTSSRSIFQNVFAKAFDKADGVVIGDPSRMDRISPEERLDADRLAADIGDMGIEAAHVGDVDKIADWLVAKACSGDTIAVLSNGGFGGLHDKLLAKLSRKHPDGVTADKSPEKI